MESWEGSLINFCTLISIKKSYLNDQLRLWYMVGKGPSFIPTNSTLLGPLQVDVFSREISHDSMCGKWELNIRLWFRPIKVYESYSEAKCTGNAMGSSAVPHSPSCSWPSTRLLYEIVSIKNHGFALYTFTIQLHDSWLRNVRYEEMNTSIIA